MLLIFLSEENVFDSKDLIWFRDKSSDSSKLNENNVFSSIESMMLLERLNETREGKDMRDREVSLEILLFLMSRDSSEDSFVDKDSGMLEMKLLLSLSDLRFLSLFREAIGKSVRLFPVRMSSVRETSIPPKEYSCSEVILLFCKLSDESGSP